MFEVNPHSADSVQGLQAGDFVSVHVLGDFSKGLMGTVVRSGKERLRLIAHQSIGPGYVDECLGWDCEFPWSSIAFVRHLPGRPVDCACREGM